jgi:hypothetical protein
MDKVELREMFSIHTDKKTKLRELPAWSLTHYEISRYEQRSVRTP